MKNHDLNFGYRLKLEVTAQLTKLTVGLPVRVVSATTMGTDGSVWSNKDNPYSLSLLASLNIIVT